METATEAHGASHPAGATGAIGAWHGDGSLVAGDAAVSRAIGRLAEPVCLVRDGDQLAVATGGRAELGAAPTADARPLVAYLPRAEPERLGDPSFCADHGLKTAYVAGAMANGIASTAICRAMGQAGMVGFFGAAGLAPSRVIAAIDDLHGDGLEADCADAPYGFNLIHSPNEPALEAQIAELYVRRGIRLVSASAYLGLTLPLLRYRFAGIHEGPDGRVVTPNSVIGKVSRIEVASRFFAPPPEAMLRELVAAGHLTEAQAALAARVPVAQDLTAEADSGGHTDNRPALALLPTLLALRDRLQAEHGFDRPLRVGAAGGIATPASAAAAFSMGAAYILTGSVNQACVEAGTSDTVRQMLAETQQADVAMAPAADMFEMGVKVQVLKRGTMFAMRGGKLYELYRTREGLHALTAAERTSLERGMFKQSLDQVWAETRAFFAERDPREVTRAEADPKHKMGLVFRWYLGQSSRWANAGVPDRKLDYQVWCGPAMGAFNEWVRGSFLEAPPARDVVTIAKNLMYGAALTQRLSLLRQMGVDVPTPLRRLVPLTQAEIEERLKP